MVFIVIFRFLNGDDPASGEGMPALLRVNVDSAIDELAATWSLQAFATNLRVPARHAAPNGACETIARVPYKHGAPKPERFS